MIGTKPVSIANDRLSNIAGYDTRCAVASYFLFSPKESNQRNGARLAAPPSAGCPCASRQARRLRNSQERLKQSSRRPLRAMSGDISTDTVNKLSDAKGRGLAAVPATGPAANESRPLPSTCLRCLAAHTGAQDRDAAR